MVVVIKRTNVPSKKNVLRNTIDFELDFHLNYEFS